MKDINTIFDGWNKIRSDFPELSVAQLREKWALYFASELHSLQSDQRKSLIISPSAVPLKSQLMKDISQYIGEKWPPLLLAYLVDIEESIQKKLKSHLPESEKLDFLKHQLHLVEKTKETADTLGHLPGADDVKCNELSVQTEVLRIKIEKAITKPRKAPTFKAQIRETRINCLTSEAQLFDLFKALSGKYLDFSSDELLRESINAHFLFRGKNILANDQNGIPESTSTRIDWKKTTTLLLYTFDQLRKNGWFDEEFDERHNVFVSDHFMVQGKPLFPDGLARTRYNYEDPFEDDKQQTIRSKPKHHQKIDEILRAVGLVIK